jgi:hypothetical protein
VEHIQGIMDEAGSRDIRIPEDIDGEMIQVNVPSSVTTKFGTCPDPDTKPEEQKEEDAEKYADCKVLVQLPAPVMVAPPSLNVTVLGAELLKLLGFTEEQARTFSESVDWATTFVIPMPTDHRLEVQEIDVDGVKGHLFMNSARERKSFTVLWIRDGILYSLIGKGSTEEAVTIANSM